MQDLAMVAAVAVVLREIEASQVGIPLVVPAPAPAARACQLGQLLGSLGQALRVHREALVAHCRLLRWRKEPADVREEMGDRHEARSGGEQGWRA